MRSTRSILAILLSLALFVQGVAASTLRACHMRSTMVAQLAQSSSQASHENHHQHGASDEVAKMTDMSMASDGHESDAASTYRHLHNDSDQPKTSKLTTCAWCAACCISFALPVSGVASPELFPGAHTVFPPIAVAPSSRLPGGWDRPPRA